MTITRTFTLSHPQLGGLTGRLIDQQHADGQTVTEPVAHFRSIPYATIKARFSQSVLLDHIPEQFDDRPHGDFTQYGAACPQVPQPFGRGSATGGLVPGEEPVTYDEQSCLNLTISAPAKNFPETRQSMPKRLLPVLVYVHGGGFIEGKGHVSALHDTTKMAELASHEAMDVVIVSIGYRVNWQGFIACYDLLEEAKEIGEPAFNYGLRDQRNSFLWVRKYIAGFGGDPDNITAFGESAGAASLFMHACSDVPLFNRVIIQSGTPNVVGSWTLDEFDAYYHNLLSYLGITGSTRAERLKALREAPVSRLIDFVRDNNLSSMKPFLGPESEFFPQQPFWANQGEILAKCPWIQEIMIGDASCEGLVLASPLKDIYASPYIGQVRKVLGDESAHRVLDAYEIHEGMDEGLFWQHVMVIIGDQVFAEPTHSAAISVARGGRQRLYRWQFGLPNPFPGSVFSYATGHHFVELMYQFMTLSARLPTHRNHFLRRQGEEMARSWIRFANGLPPMPGARPYDLEEGSIMICDMLQGWTVRTRAEDEVISQNDPWGPRRYHQWEVLNEELKKAGWINSGSGSDNESIEAKRNALLIRSLKRCYHNKSQGQLPEASSPNISGLPSSQSPASQASRRNPAVRNKFASPRGERSSRSSLQNSVQQVAESFIAADSATTVEVDQESRRFACDSNPIATLMEQNESRLLGGRSKKGDVGAWLCAEENSIDQGDSPGSPSQTAPGTHVHPDRLPSKDCQQALVDIYFRRVHPLLPLLDEDQVRTQHIAGKLSPRLVQVICLVAAKDRNAVPFLCLGPHSKAVPLDKFSNILYSDAIQNISRRAEKKVLAIQILALLSLHEWGSTGSEDCSLNLAQAIHHAQTIGLHLLRQDQNSGTSSSGLFWCLWSLDRWNAAMNGRPLMIHDGDMSQRVDDMISTFQSPFRVWLRIADKLGEVIHFYRPIMKGVDQSELNLPLFEDLVEHCEAWDMSPALLAGCKAVHSHERQESDKVIQSLPSRRSVAIKIFRSFCRFP
ncbi:unnamed protein product [Penicillium glandicola]